MKSNLIGKWRNEYGSILDIRTHGPAGHIAGLYTSDTGSSGVYPWVGYTAQDVSGHRALALAVPWFPLGGTDRDPSWNWVSVMAGVLHAAPGRPGDMRLSHHLVASSPMPTVEISAPGVFVDRLSFRNCTEPPQRPHLQQINRAGTATKALRVSLECCRDPDALLQRVDVVCNSDGTCSGRAFLASAGHAIEVQGFVDHAATNPRSVALVGLAQSMGDHSCFSMAGLLHDGREFASLQVQIARPVSVENAFSAVESGSAQYRVSITAP